MMIPFANLNATMLVSIRLGVLLFLTPIQALRQLPGHCRLFLLLGLSGTIVYGLSLEVQANDLQLIADAGVELINGLTLALGVMSLFAVFNIAGYLMDTQIGLNAMALFNPTEHSHDPLSARFLNLLATLFFLGMNGHHWLLRGIADSLQVAAPGQLFLTADYRLLIKHAGLMFSLAFMLASPIMLGLFLVDTSAALLTRNMPQISTYFLLLPLKIMLGLALFMATLNYFQPFYEHAMMLLFQPMQGMQP